VAPARLPLRLRPHLEVPGALEAWEQAAMVVPEGTEEPPPVRAARVVEVAGFAISLVAAMPAPTSAMTSTIAALVAISAMQRRHFAIKVCAKSRRVMALFAGLEVRVAAAIAVSPGNYVAMFLVP